MSKIKLEMKHDGIQAIVETLNRTNESSLPAGEGIIVLVIHPDGVATEALLRLNIKQIKKILVQLDGLNRHLLDVLEKHGKAN